MLIYFQELLVMLCPTFSKFCVLFQYELFKLIVMVINLIGADFKGIVCVCLILYLLVFVWKWWITETGALFWIVLVSFHCMPYFFSFTYRLALAGGMLIW